MSTPSPTDGGGSNVFGIPLVGGITEGGAIILAVLGVIILFLVVVIRFGSRILAGIAAARKQLENDHQGPDGPPANLRENLDVNHKDVKGAIDDLAVRIGRLADGQLATLTSLGALRVDVQAVTRRLDDHIARGD